MEFELCSLRVSRTISSLTSCPTNCVLPSMSQNLLIRRWKVLLNKVVGQENDVRTGAGDKMPILSCLFLQERRIRPDGNTRGAISGDGEKWHLVFFQAPTPSSSRKRAKGASVYLCSSREAIPGIQRIVENALLLNLRKLSQRRHQRFAKGIALNFSREIPC